MARDEEGKPYTVRYEAVNAMLLNEFLKEHRKVESLEKALGQQQETMEELSATLKKQAAQIEKVIAQQQIRAGTPQRVSINNKL